MDEQLQVPLKYSCCICDKDFLNMVHVCVCVCICVAVLIIVAYTLLAGIFANFC